MGLRVGYVVFCLVGFAAVMLGLRYLLTGFGEPFGAGIGCGGMIGIAAVGLVVDRDQSHEERRAIPMMFLLVVGAAMGLGHSLGRFDVAPVLLGTAIGFLAAFALTYWVNGMDRAKRGDPRRPYRN